MEYQVSTASGLRVFAVFSFGSENWSWTIQTLERIKEWETGTMLRLFRFSSDESVNGMTVLQLEPKRSTRGWMH